VTRPTKAVFPLSALGQRSAPSAGTGRVEMMPIMDKPLIQYAIEDALEGGFTELVFITGPGRRAGIGNGRPDHYELAAALEVHGRTELLEAIRDFVPRGAECIFIRQADPTGVGGAVLAARAVIGNSPFAVVLADELVQTGESLLARMVEQYESYRCSIIGAYETGYGDTCPHGRVKCTAWLNSLFQVGGIGDQPAIGDGAKSLGIAGRYIFTPALLRHLEAIAKMQPAGEISLADGLARLLRQETVLAFNFEGARYDCGSKLGYLKAMLAFGLAHPEVGGDLALHLETLKKEDPTCAASSVLSRSAM
jgi:UTP--glucose-1-phosphate uridylyltransferase